MGAVEVHSGEYVELFKDRPISRVRNLVERMDIGDADHIVDFGCGDGKLLQALGPRAGMYEGVDFSPDFIASAEEQATGTNYRFHCRDIVEFCNEHRGEFDIAATLDFSEHIDDESFRFIYSAIRQSLKPGGKLYLHTPNRDFFMEGLKDRGVLPQLAGHIAVRDGEQNEALLRRCGFEKITIETVPHYNALRFLHPLRKLPLVGRYFGARLWVTAS